MAGFAAIASRSIIAVTGEERTAFLQRLLTNDLHRVGPERAVYALLLTPQGRFLHDLFVADGDASVLLDAEAERLGDLMRRLTTYRLRAKVAFTDCGTEQAVFVAFGSGAAAILGLSEETGAARAFAGGVAFVDPRRADLGVRLILPRAEGARALAAAGLTEWSEDDYDRLRLSLGVPDGSRDLPVERALPIECALDTFNAIAFDKGCYVGQEMTARTHFRAPVRKRLLPVTVDGPMPPSGTAILAGETEAGCLFSGRDGVALALLRLEVLERARVDAIPLLAGTAIIAPRAGYDRVDDHRDAGPG